MNYNMEKISIKELYKNEIEKIWNDAKIDNTDLIDRGYVVHDEIIKNAILFIGINPSYPKENPAPGNHFVNHDENEKLYAYFKKFQKIATETKQSWSHLDLLYFRETKQKYIWDLLKENNGGGCDFVYKQLMLSKEMIFKAKPKIIVVSNTLARHFMGFEKSEDRKNGVWMDFDCSFDNDLGTHRLTNTELKGTPIFFTSMLTGQRALDKGSFKRLAWHINFVLEKLKNSNS
ncbi:hypothetical protein [Flavobacterium lindanitolerans]|uniref:hypothetical protein n=2 Tax=Flavobacterium TaxID=237 RepID=UPI0028070C85|nr:hypothetical protein [Flavobacterium lindanitolerans]MDQ7960394.1 hypothetical protein [Flavobacterium lindanitolerans]